jgi:hypothetical protein
MQVSKVKGLLSLQSLFDLHAIFLQTLLHTASPLAQETQSTSLSLLQLDGQ